MEYLEAILRVVKSMYGCGMIPTQHRLLIGKISIVCHHFHENKNWG